VVGAWGGADARLNDRMGMHICAPGHETESG
jgi:hypothetical protein